MSRQPPTFSVPLKMLIIIIVIVTFFCHFFSFLLLSDWSDWKGDLPPTVCLFCEESYPATNQALQHMKVHLQKLTQSRQCYETDTVYTQVKSDILFPYVTLAINFMASTLVP